MSITQELVRNRPSAPPSTSELESAFSQALRVICMHVSLRSTGPKAGASRGVWYLQPIKPSVIWLLPSPGAFFAVSHSTNCAPAILVILWSDNLSNSVFSQAFVSPACDVLPPPFPGSALFYPVGLSLNNILLRPCFYKPCKLGSALLSFILAIVFFSKRKSKLTYIFLHVLL